MRFFIALEIPEKSKSELKLVQEKIKKLLPNTRLTDLEKLHLTIAFIGDKDESLKDNFIEVIKKASENIPPFEVTPAFVDGFPNLHYPDILWCGVKGDIDKLMVIRERVNDGLLGLEVLVDQRRYTPHITLAKGSSLIVSQDAELQLQNLMMETKFSPINVTSIKLFESVPTHEVHKHSVLGEVYLK